VVVEQFSTPIAIASMFGPVMYEGFTHVTEEVKVVKVFRRNSSSSAMSFVDYISISRVSFGGF
jgi:predicted CoA-binding protein